jgi:major type 1 subunit fimbrin (pilin)
MKKLALSAMVTALGWVSVAQAASGTINFRGQVDTSTCVPGLGSADPNFTVVLPTVSTRSLSAPGSTVGHTGFFITLSDCSGALKTAAAYFEGSPGDVDLITGRLKNYGSAANASLQLYNGTSGRPIMAGSISQTDDGAAFFNLAEGNVMLPHIVAYYAEGSVGPGTVIGKVDYTIVYK